MLSIQISLAQPGNGNGGGNGGGPGGGNGNDPCLGPRPPRNCNNVPIKVDLLIVLGAFAGAVFTIKNKLSDRKEAENIPDSKQ